MKRRGAVVLATLVLLAAGAAAFLLGGSGDDAADGSLATGGATGTVARRTLAERLTATGMIGYAGQTEVLARLTGTVTALPAVGAVIRRDGRLYAVDGEPVLLMYGAVPVYRTLAEGVDDGPDVEQLKRNLAALGYEPGTVDEDFTGETAAAVAAWQRDLGLEPSGELELGRVTFLRGPQRVTKLVATLGEALGSRGKGGGSGSGSADGSEPVSTPVLRSSSTRRVVGVHLGADQQSIAHRGQPVGVVLPGGAEVPGEVHGLAAVELAGGEGNPGEGEPGVAATISLTGGRRIPALDGSTVDVRFTERVRRDVLSVPLTALIAIGGERFAVEVRDPGTALRRIVVTPGLAADGYVEVEGKGLRAGMKVETGE